MILDIKGLHKSYGDVHALQNFSIKLVPGIYGLLGPNGAGKSALMNILSMLLKQDSGCIYYDGTDIQMMKSTYLKTIGYMPQFSCLYDDFTLAENLYYIAALKGVSKQQIKSEMESLVEKVRLQEVLYKKVGTFSGGMRQRAMFAQTMLGHPKILILDEPTAGLDPQRRIELRNLIARMSKNCIVLIATHVVSDVEFIANKIILLNKGCLIAEGTPQQLAADLNEQVYEAEIPKEEMDSLKEKELISNLHYEGNKLIARIIQPTVKLSDSHLVLPDLNDVYLYHFGREAL